MHDLVKNWGNEMGTPEWLAPEWHVVPFHLHFQRLIYCPDITSDLRLKRSKVFRGLRHRLSAKSTEIQTIDCLVERGVERGGARRSALEGRERGGAP